MKGIVLAGGKGSRLRPITTSVTKQLHSIFDKPLIYYPLSTLMLANIREILLITTLEDRYLFEKLLGDGKKLGLNIEYLVQDQPEGIAQAFIIGERFISNNDVCLVLGDNLFHGAGLGRSLANKTPVDGSLIFGYEVNNPERYGVAEVSSSGEVISIEEKPNEPKSRLAIPGLYFFDNTVVQKAKNIQRSQRGEYEITSVLECYMREKRLSIEILDRGTTWMDCGTFQSMNDASNYIRAIQERQGNKIAAIEEIAWRKGWITDFDLSQVALEYKESEYSSYLINQISKK